MKVFEILFDVTDVDNEITRENCYWTAPSLYAATVAASIHAYEYEKELMSVREVLTITQEIKPGEIDEHTERFMRYLNTEDSESK